MCCSLGEAELTNTIISCIETKHPKTGRAIHVLGYQNKARSFAGPNAMLLPFPAAAPMGPENILDTRACPQILSDYATAATPKFGLSFSGTTTRSASKSIQVFDSGNYTVVLANDANLIPSALDRVPANKRPPRNQPIFDRYAHMYRADKGWQFGLCCWDGAVDAEPLMWWFEPQFESKLFFPGLDAHDGRPPALDSIVAVDHTLVVGSYMREVGDMNEVWFTRRPPIELQPFVCSHVAGAEFKREEGDDIVFDEGHLPNGDWWFDVDNFKKLSSEPQNNKALFQRSSPLAV